MLNNSDKYGKVTLERKMLPQQEPIFVLRGQDMLASAAVRHYAFLYLRTTRDREGYDSILAQARAIDNWPIKKTPD